MFTFLYVLLPMIFLSQAQEMFEDDTQFTDGVEDAPTSSISSNSVLKSLRSADPRFGGILRSRRSSYIRNGGILRSLRSVDPHSDGILILGNPRMDGTVKYGRYIYI